MSSEDQIDTAIYVGVKGAERLTSISRWTWRAWARSRKIESIKAGRRLLIPVAEIQRVLREGVRPRVEAKQC